MPIAVYGLGNIGLPLACIFASVDKVIGVDVDKKKVESINQGISPLSDEEKVPALIKKYVNEGKLEATTDFDYAGKTCNIKIVIVPLILNENKNPDFSIIEEVTKKIASTLKKGDLVVVSTTMPVGTTNGVVRKILEELSGLKAGEDFYLAHAPERTMNPHVIADITENYRQFIGGINQKSGEIAKQLYEKVCKKGVVLVRNCETAELIKLCEGIYRYVNIALSKEIAEICEKFDVDYLDVMKGTNDIEYYHLHLPTIGVGGLCIPVYPHFIKNEGISGLVAKSIETNENLPKYSVDMIKKFVGDLSGKKIAILGLTFKEGVKEDRFSPTYELIKILKKENVKLYINDPYYSEDELKIKTGLDVIQLENLNEMDGIILASPLEEFKKLKFSGNIKFVFDGKSFLDKDDIIEKGIKYIAIGRTCYS